MNIDETSEIVCILCHRVLGFTHHFTDVYLTCDRCIENEKRKLQ